MLVPIITKHTQGTEKKKYTKEEFIIIKHLYTISNTSLHKAYHHDNNLCNINMQFFLIFKFISILVILKNLKNLKI